MTMRTYFLILATTLTFLAPACTQRTDTPPANRDGISGGSNTPPKPEAKGALNGGGKGDLADLTFDGIKEEFELGPDEYTVLVSSLPTKQQAQELAYVLRTYRINNFIDHVGDEWLVGIGKYRSAKAAQKTLLLLRRRGLIAKLQQIGYDEPVIYGPGHGL